MENLGNMKDDESILKAVKEMTGDTAEFVELTDTFGFKCQQCGKCCMHRDDIILNPFDIYNGAKYLGITCEEFMLKYTVVNLGGQSKIPIVLLKSEDNGFCSLLKFDIKDGGKFKCTIHEAKPGVCANHPIGVVRGRHMDGNSFAENGLNFIKVSQCPRSVSDEQQVVGDWVKKYLDHEEEVTYAHDLQTLSTDYFNTREFWFVTVALRDIVEKHGSKLSEDSFPIKVVTNLLKTYILTVVSLTYADYDISRPFIEQAEKNKNELCDFYTRTKDLFEHLSDFYHNLTGKTITEALKEYDTKEE